MLSGLVTEVFSPAECITGVIHVRQQRPIKYQPIVDNLSGADSGTKWAARQPAGQPAVHLRRKTVAETAVPEFAYMRRLSLIRYPLLLVS